MVKARLGDGAASDPGTPLERHDEVEGASAGEARPTRDDAGPRLAGRDADGALVMSDLVGAQVLRPLFGRMRPCFALPSGTVRWLAPSSDVGSLPSLHAANFFAMTKMRSKPRRSGRGR